MAILTIGAVTVPIYPTLPGPQVAPLLVDSGATGIFVSTKAQRETVESVRSQVPDVGWMWCFEDEPLPAGGASAAEGGGGQAPGPGRSRHDHLHLRHDRHTQGRDADSGELRRAGADLARGDECPRYGRLPLLPPAESRVRANLRALHHALRGRDHRVRRIDREDARQYRRSTAHHSPRRAALLGEAHGACHRREQGRRVPQSADLPVGVRCRGARGGAPTAADVRFHRGSRFSTHSRTGSSIPRSRIVWAAACACAYPEAPR